MATPQRNLVIERIATVLGNISVANGYKTDVDTVAREIVEWASIGNNQFPYVCYRPGRTTYDHTQSDLVRATMRIDVVIHVNTATAAARSDQLSGLEDDIWLALSDSQMNSSSGGTDVATQTKILEYETDEGDPDTMDHKGGTGTGHLVAEVTYYRTTGGS